MMDCFDRVERSVDYIKSQIKEKVRFAVILGSGFSLTLPDLENEVRLSYSDIPHFPKNILKGHPGEIRYGGFGSKKVLFFCGRFHLYQGFSAFEVSMPIMVASKLGAKLVVLTNAAGGINRSFKPGDIMLIKDHINLMGENPLIGIRSIDSGEVFIDMSNAYPEHLQDEFIKSAERTGYNRIIKRGVYIGVKGPNYETPAEINFFAKIGADAVGMSTVPEVIMAVYNKIDVLGISIISNMAAGVSSSNLQHLQHSKVLEIITKAGENFFKILKEFFSIIPNN